MPSIFGYTEEQIEIALGLAEQYTIEKAALMMNCSPTTIKRWKKEKRNELTKTEPEHSKSV